MRWDPPRGHVPRGFHGAYGTQSEVELVLVFAEPGNPHEGESHTGIDSAYDYAGLAFSKGKDLFHRNVRAILNSCWPDEALERQFRRVWLTESVLCSAEIEGGPVPKLSSSSCAKRYLLAQLALFPDAVVVALGRKAQTRLRAAGFKDFTSAYAVAPPGCNFKKAAASWKKISEAVRARREA